MISREKKSFKQTVEKLKVKDMIKNAQAKGIVNLHTEAFKENPTQTEKHKGNINYFANV